MSEPAGERPEVTADDVAAQVGRSFPGGEFTVERWFAWLLADAALEQPRASVSDGAVPEGSGDELAHPLLAWTAATQAMGVTWDELFAWFGSSADDGPMFGEHETVWHAPMRVGRTYLVSGEITSADRKSGRSGMFDVIGYAFRLHDKEGGAHVADCWNSLILPRRHS
ncbi:MaoC family dehydratase N-terminal domain-containing protein [Prauserella alba]|uniref:N-terminal half of MaoC dehydratase n=1 Tax=Prauserella alba TaxID=176898 RepID=A0ABN1VCC6_9PSEU|nr:MaoC family dehydratase N-terminal domain-containing protein [Prauserella alba]MCP2179705.1 N-terminal half of MaoC dehydratase [Prauserella alba]